MTQRSSITYTFFACCFVHRTAMQFVLIAIKNNFDRVFFQLHRIHMCHLFLRYIPHYHCGKGIKIFHQQAHTCRPTVPKRQHAEWKERDPTFCFMERISKGIPPSRPITAGHPSRVVPDCSENNKIFGTLGSDQAELTDRPAGCPGVTKAGGPGPAGGGGAPICGLAQNLPKLVGNISTTSFPGVGEIFNSCRKDSQQVFDPNLGLNFLEKTTLPQNGRPVKALLASSAARLRSAPAAFCCTDSWRQGFPELAYTNGSFKNRFSPIQNQACCFVMQFFLLL